MLVIGERINATNKAVAEAIGKRDITFLQGLASTQVAAGADYLDVNTGRGHVEQEPADMEWLIEIIQEVTDKPLVIDSADPRVIEAGLRKYKGNAVMINSISAEKARLEAIAPLVKNFTADVIALAMDDKGIPESVEERIVACDRIVEGLNAYDITPDKILFDPLVIPVGVGATQGTVTLNTLQQVKQRYPGARTTMGLSNISYGLPNRGTINQAFLLLSMYAGLDSAIINPSDRKLMGFIKIGKMLFGRDPYCKEYLTAHRKGVFKE
jgi:5-methyltetrahydrofolate--homocysteine methyltransferase